MAPLGKTAGLLGLVASTGNALRSMKPIPAGWKPPAEYEDPDFASNVVARLKANMQQALTEKGFGPGERTLTDLQQKVKADPAMRFDRTEGGMNEVSLAGSQSKLDSSHAIRYTRSRGSADAGFHFNVSIDQGCSGSDIFGDNNCTFVSGQTAHMRITVLTDREIDADAKFSVRFNTRIFGLASVIKQQLFDKRVRGSFKQMVPEVNFTCAACGATCEIGAWGGNWTQEMPPCPILAGKVYTLLEQPVQVPQAAFLKMISSDSNLTAWLKSGDGTVLSESDARIRVGEAKDEACPPLKAILGKC